MTTETLEVQEEVAAQMVGAVGTLVLLLARKVRMLAAAALEMTEVDLWVMVDRLVQVMTAVASSSRRR